MNTLKALVNVLVVWILIYLLGSFASAGFDIRIWEPWVRVSCAVFALYATIFVGGMTLENNHD